MPGAEKKKGDDTPRVQNPCYYKASNRWGVKIGSKEVVSVPRHPEFLLKNQKLHHGNFSWTDLNRFVALPFLFRLCWCM